MNDLLKQLEGGDLRSDGRANEVAGKVLKGPHLIGKLVEGLSEPDVVVCGRTAHVLERISRTNPEMLQTMQTVILKLFQNHPFQP